MAQRRKKAVEKHNAEKISKGSLKKAKGAGDTYKIQMKPDTDGPNTPLL